MVVGGSTREGDLLFIDDDVVKIEFQESSEKSPAEKKGGDSRGRPHSCVACEDQANAKV